VRDEGRVAVAVLTRHLGDLGLAEDAVQDATLAALDTWPRTGVPPNPRAWLLRTARHRALDRIRREAKRAGKEAEAVALLEQEATMPTDALEPTDPSAVDDDVLRLVFTCCHPALAPEAQVALSLRTLCGLSTGEVARALLVTEATMTKRLTRARQKIAVAAIPYRVPSDHDLPARLAAVTAVVYLVFNEGYAATEGQDHVRSDLAEEAIRLGRMLLDLMPGEPSLQGLLALMLLQHARAAARVTVGDDGEPRLVLLSDQDRTMWDRDAIAEGVVLVGEGLRRSPDRPDPYVVQAAIAGCHALAPTWAETDWPAIVSWYDVLLTVQDTPIVRLNRAAAIAESPADGAGPGAALDLVDAIDGLDRYALWHASRAELLDRLGRRDEAADALTRALALPTTAAMEALLRSRLSALDG
jgi:RNA polymerase sigma factor (sigma-70 family)